jgi:hypothetical protein
MRRNRRRLPIPQHEFGFTPQAFNLIHETSLDGDRIARDRAEVNRAHSLAEAAQATLFNANLPTQNSVNTAEDFEEEKKTDTKMDTILDTK